MPLFKKRPEAYESCDVLFLYEIKNREIENLCLLKYELERKGYSVKILPEFESFFVHHKPIDAKLVVVGQYYNKRFQYYASSHSLVTEKILNLMWEQVFINQDENNSNTLFSIEEWGRSASHIAWGTNMRDRLLNEWKCDPSHVFMTGHMTLDFLRGSLVRYYDSRENLFRSFGIPTDKKVHLFISSLVYADVDMRALKRSPFGNNMDELLQHKKMCSDTRRELLVWFEKMLEADEDSVIIYRPHPEEKGDEYLFDLAKRQKRFLIIREKSVKQWIIACDKIYTWTSTSILEVIASGKDFNVLRPLPIPYKNDIVLYSDMSPITTFEEFRENFSSDIHKDKGSLYKSLEQYYFIPEQKYSYELICDAIEKILAGDEYRMIPPLKNQLLKWYYPERIKNVIKRLVARSKLFERFHRSNLLKTSLFRECVDDIFYVKEKLQKNHTSEEEIAQITDRIKNAISSDCVSE